MTIFFSAKLKYFESLTLNVKSNSQLHLESNNILHNLITKSFSRTGIRKTKLNFHLYYSSQSN